MSFHIHQGDALTVLRTLPEASVNCCITSPPYWGLRDYGTATWEGGAAGCDHVYNHGTQGMSGQRADRTFTGQAVYRAVCGKCGASRSDEQIGLEDTPGEWVQKMVDVFGEVRRVLRNDGTLWVNIGDSYCSGTGADRLPTTLAGGRVPASWSNRSQPQRIRPVAGLKAKDLCMMPARLAIALQEDGWWLRSDIIWAKPAPMPESVRDRPTKAHEYIYLLSKCAKYFYDANAIKEPSSPDSHARYARGRSDTHKWADGGPGNQTIAKSFDHMREPGVHPKSAEPGSGIKANSSFSAAVKDLVDVRNKRSWWVMSSAPTPEAHFATFPIELPETCLKAGCPESGTVLDPFAGAGTTGLACLKNGRGFIGIELNPSYISIAYSRARKYYPLLMGAEVSA